MNGISTNFSSENIYPKTIGTAAYNGDEAFASSVSKLLESKEENYDFSDMYVRTYQHSAEDAIKDFYGTGLPWKNEKYLHVPVAGDLKELFESIEKGLADGESLRNILQNRIDKYAKECGEPGAIAVGTLGNDLILVDPETGKVIDSMIKDRVIILSQKMQDTDYATVKSQADDLATFLRYAVFKKETDDPEKVSALISELKDKQSDYDTSRFLPIFYSGGTQGKKNLEYWLNLLGPEWGNELSEDERNDAADELLKILKERDSSDKSTNNELLEEMNKMKHANAAAAKMMKRVLVTSELPM